MGCVLPLHMMILIDIICMCLLLLLAIIMIEELHFRLFMFPTRKNWKKLFILCIGLYYVCMNCSFMTCRCIGRELDFVLCMIYITLCSLLNHKSLLIKIGFDIPWDPGGSITSATYAQLNGFNESAARETTQKFQRVIYFC